jgi:adenine-specific DNA-methyltransferase
MPGMLHNMGRVLEPACGDGAFSARIPRHGREIIAIELDPKNCPVGALNIDFFAYPDSEMDTADEWREALGLGSVA